MTASGAGRLPRELLVQGSALARGYWFFSSSSMPEQSQQPHPERAERRLRARALAEYRQGDRLLEFPLGWVLEFGTPRRVRADSAPGAVLLRSGGALVSAPFGSKLKLPPEARLALVFAGELRCFDDRDLREIDLATLLDLRSFALASVESLGELAPPAVLARSDDPIRSAEARLGIDGEHKRSREAVIAQLNSEPMARASGIGSALTLLHGAFGSLLRSLRAVRQAFDSARSKPAPTTEIVRRERASHGAAAQLLRALGQSSERLRGWIERQLLLRHFGLKQAQYLGELFELLESRNDAEALRRALPLGGETSADGPQRLALLPPSPRQSLQIQLGRLRGAKNSINLAPSLYARLRQAYESMFRRLDEAGRHDDAAFVLSELLHDNQRAVGYLETHRKFRLAAELAESRQLAPGLCVRLWFLARDQRRAVALAVRHDCFADAIQRLERAKQSEAASELRLLFADRLASAGKLLTAAQTLAPHAPSRSLALRWLELAREAGELEGIALELSLAPERIDAVWARVERMLEAQLDEELPQLAKLAKALDQRQLELALPLTRVLARALLAGAVRTGDNALAATASAAAKASGGLLAADWPRAVDFPALPPTTLTRRRYSIAAHGGRECHDAFRYAGRWVVALGDGGVALTSAGGRVVRHFDVPATRLVVAAGLPHLLAVTARDDILFVHRIHLATLRAEPWGELRARTIATEFDGERWLVVTEQAGESTLSILDVLATKPELIDRVPLGPGAVRLLKVSNASCHALSLDADLAADSLHLSLPDGRLRGRRQRVYEAVEGHRFRGCFAISDGGNVVLIDREVNLETRQMGEAVLLYGGRSLRLGELGEPQQLVASDDYFAVALAPADPASDARVIAGSLTTGPTLELSFERTVVVALRISHAILCVTLAAGRAFEFDIARARELSSITL